MENKFLSVFEGKTHTIPPFWFMRQAGRYMPEYRALREKAGSFLNLCFNSDWATEVTLQPIREFDMDAAILFADILLIPMAMGVDLRFETGEGPKLGKTELGKLNFDENQLQPVYQTLKNLSQSPELKNKGLIGFAGSPWTVACYMIEQGSPKKFAKVDKLEPELEKLYQYAIDEVTKATITYLSSQVDAGAQVVQLFDSWASETSDYYYDKWVIKPTAEIVAALKAKYPKLNIIGFPRRVSKQRLKQYLAATKVDALGIDQTIDLEWAFENLDCVIQGNMNPEILLQEKAAIKAAAEEILKAAQGKKFIFNLGHGISQFTPVENVAYLCEVIRSYK